MVPEIGSIVKSEAGRIKGYFVVVKIENGYYFLADGRRCTAEKPKKKKLKHIAVTDGKAADVAEKLSKGSKVGRETLKRALKPYQN